MTRYETPEALRAAIEDRLRNEGAGSGTDVARLRRRTVFERLLVRLERASPGTWVVKGGMALELRLGGRARTTRDLDLSVRANAVLDEVHTLLVDALIEDPDGDGFEPPDPMSPPGANWTLFEHVATSSAAVAPREPARAPPERASPRFVEPSSPARR